MPRELERIRQAFQRAQDEALLYVGTRPQLEKLVQLVARFEICALEFAGQTRLVFPATEPVVRDAAQRAGLPALTTNDLLDIANEGFHAKLKQGGITFAGKPLGYVFAPPDNQDEVEPEHATGRERIIEDRTLRLKELLLNEGNIPRIFADDLVVYPGIVTRDMWRRVPYTLIQIPRLNRELIVCDQYGEATYIGEGQRGPLFWASRGKRALQNTEGVTKVEHNAGYIPYVLSRVFANNHYQAETVIKLPARDSFPLTADVVLMTTLRNLIPLIEKELGEKITPSADFDAVRQAMSRLGDEFFVLPTQNSGDIPDLPGQRWDNWDLAIRRQGRHFDYENIAGLSGLFKLFGLKFGNTENRERIIDGILNIAHTGNHGLTPQPEPQLTADFMLCKLLEYAEQNHDPVVGYRLPADNNGDEVPGMPGQIWSTWRRAIVEQSRGFDIPGVTGINDLCNLYNLKIGETVNPEAIAKGIGNLRQARETNPSSLAHRLEPVDPVVLTTDFIIRTALRQADVKVKTAVFLGQEILSDERLLPRNDDSVHGYPGQIYRNWNQAMKRNQRGFDFPGINSMTELYRAYGLVDDNGQENREAIFKAIDNMNDNSPIRPIRNRDGTPTTSTLT